MKMIIKKKDGHVFIPQCYYDDTGKDYKGVFEGNVNECNIYYDGDWDKYIKTCPQIGKRTWMPPFDLFNMTCLLVESEKFSILNDLDFMDMLNNGVYKVSYDGITMIFREQ